MTKVVLLILFWVNSILAQEGPVEESKPLLRVFPIFRVEECEWAIHMFVCQRCVKHNVRYAQKIYFFQDRPYRVHGCYTDERGFYKID